MKYGSKIIFAVVPVCRRTHDVRSLTFDVTCRIDGPIELTITATAGSCRRSSAGSLARAASRRRSQAPRASRYSAAVSGMSRIHGSACRTATIRRRSDGDGHHEQRLANAEDAAEQRRRRAHQAAARPC